MIFLALSAARSDYLLVRQLLGNVHVSASNACML